ncbi:hypothetical protein GCM10009639_35450 [Kitasatospora putterlickiae]|uniref:Carrier domain-containing protein n=1 Tax=Kitasatospora putterlickiae TaxID=221725 RepID=A0ABP4ISD5_9ACTN
MSDIRDHLVALLGDTFEVDPATIRPDATLSELGLDSLGVAELLVVLQERWGVPLDEGLGGDDLTVESLTAVVTELRADT